MWTTWFAVIHKLTGRLLKNTGDILARVAEGFKPLTGLMLI
ncbi:hypothetical protein RABR111495_01795 [Rahnella bruchi]